MLSILTDFVFYPLGDSKGQAVSPFHDIPLYANNEVSAVSPQICPYRFIFYH